jgi:hypothetical protein
MVGGMGVPVRVVATAVLCLGLTACVKTTGGSVATTTEPGGPITTSTTTSRPSTTRTTSPSEVPAPPNAMTMTCKDFVKLDEPTRLAVVKEILKGQNSVFGPLGDEFSETVASTMCDYVPDRTVREILTGTPP